MKLARVFAGVSILAVASAGALRADFKDFSYRCTPGAVRACASIQVFTTLNGSGGTNVTVLVRNLQGGTGYGENTGGSVISRIGLVTPTITGASGLSVSGISGAGTFGTPGSQWLLRNPGRLGGLVELTAGITNNGPGGIMGCSAPWGGFPASYFQTCNAGWVSLSFTTTNAWSANAAEVAFLATSFAVDNGAFECDTDNLDSPRAQCVVATPEPITMILLGTGLAGMGGAGLIRRRKGADVSSD